VERCRIRQPLEMLGPLGVVIARFEAGALR
jgi:hypothetical protein